MIRLMDDVMDGLIAKGGPAFPCKQNGYAFVGMTMRDYFAAKAMEAMIHVGGHTQNTTILAGYAYQYADAMLKERQK